MRRRLLPAAMLAALAMAATVAWGQCGPNGCPTPQTPRFQMPRQQRQAPPSQQAVAPPVQAPANAHPAVCRIKNDFGSGGFAGTGTLIDRNEKYGLIVTNEHLVRDGVGTITCKFPGDWLTAKVLYKSAEYDLCILYTARPDVEPVEVALTAPPLGEVVTTCGYGSGAYREVSGTIRTYMHQDPPEKRGREFIRRGSGSGELNSFEATGSARPGDSGSPIFNRSGQLVGVLWGGDTGQFSGTPCTLVDQVALTAGRYLLPWNAKINDPARDPRNQPPAVQVQAPGVNVDIGPLNRDLADTQARLDAAIKSVNENRSEIDDVKARQDGVAKIAGDLADKYSEQLPGLSADVKAAIKDAADARAEAAAAKAGAANADSKVSGVVGQVAAAASTAKDAIDKAEKVKEGVDAALDPDVPTSKMGRVKAAISEKLESTMIGKIAAAKGWAFAGAVLGGVAIVLGLIAVFVKKDIKARKETGDPLLIEKLFSRLDSLAERTRNPIDDRVFDAMGNVVGRMADRIAPKPAPQQPTVGGGP